MRDLRRGVGAWGEVVVMNNEELSEERYQEITNDLGDDADAACQIAVYMVEHDCCTEDELASALNINLLEIVRLMWKLENLGLISDCG